MQKILNSFNMISYLSYQPYQANGKHSSVLKIPCLALFVVTQEKREIHLKSGSGHHGDSRGFLYHPAFSLPFSSTQIYLLSKHITCTFSLYLFVRN